MSHRASLGGPMGVCRPQAFLVVQFQSFGRAKTANLRSFQPHLGARPGGSGRRVPSPGPSRPVRVRERERQALAEHPPNRAKCISYQMFDELQRERRGATSVPPQRPTKFTPLARTAAGGKRPPASNTGNRDDVYLQTTQSFAPRTGGSAADSLADGRLGGCARGDCRVRWSRQRGPAAGYGRGKANGRGGGGTAGRPF